MIQLTPSVFGAFALFTHGAEVRIFASKIAIKQILLALLLPLSLLAQINEGKLDTTLDYQMTSDYCYQFLEMSDGNYLVAGIQTQPDQGASVFDTSGNYIDGFIGLDIRIGGVESPITKVLEQSDGKVVFVNTIRAPRVHRYDYATRAKDTTFAPTLGCPENQGQILDAELQADQKIIIAGSFPYYDQIGSSRLARINTDGSLDTNFASNIKIIGNAVNEAEIQADGKILIGGDFTAEDLTTNVEYKNLVRLNADGTVDDSFDYFSTNIIRAMDLQADGKLIVARQAGSELYERMTISRIDTDGSQDPSFSELRTIKKLGTSFTYVYVHDIHVQADGRIYLAGLFDDIRFGGVDLNDTILGVRNLTRLKTNGSVDYSFYPNADTSYYVSGRVYEVNTVMNGDVLIGGVFTQVGGVDAFYTARLTSNSGAFVGTANIASAKENDLHVYPNPSQTDFTIQIPDDASRVQAFDISGKHVQTFNEAATQARFKPENPGIYILRVIHNNGTVSHAKLIKG